MTNGSTEMEIDKLKWYLNIPDFEESTGDELLPDTNSSNYGCELH